jgi:hypothetical protein
LAVLEPNGISGRDSLGIHKDGDDLGDIAVTIGKARGGESGMEVSNVYSWFSDIPDLLRGKSIQ